MLEFFKGRFENQLIAQGHPYDVVDAILATGMDNLVAADEKIRAMAVFKSHPDFQPLAIAFKRVVNIIRGFQNGAVDPALFSGTEEKNLHEAFLKIRETVFTQHLPGGLFRRSQSNWPVYGNRWMPFSRRFSSWRRMKRSVSTGSPCWRRFPPFSTMSPTFQELLRSRRDDRTIPFRPVRRRLLRFRGTGRAENTLAIEIHIEL